MSDECITIESSDEDEIQLNTIDRLPSQLIVMEKSADVVNRKNEYSSKSTNRRAPLESVVTGKSIFSKFLAKCKETDPSRDMDLIVNKLWKRFHEADAAFTSSLFFSHLVEKLMDGVSAEPYNQMKTISDELKYRTIKIKNHQEAEETKQFCPETNVEGSVTLKTAKKIRKLEKLIEVLHRKIALLEGKEIDFDDSDDENSAYIQVSRYKDRICQVFKKVCELRNSATTENPLRSSIKFTGTRLPVVNRAIEKFYNDKKGFPDFRDMLCVVEKVNEMKRLHLSPKDCQQIAEQAFKELGEALKQQRQYDFHDTMSCYLPENREDPAAADANLKQKLEQNQRQFGNRIDEVIDKYAQKQYDENLQPDTITSDVASDDEDDDLSDDNVSSLNESDTELKEKRNDIENGAVPIVQSFQIRLTNVMSLPEWEKYNCARELPDSSTPLDSPTNEDMSNWSCKNKCEPVAGSSKDFNNDFCLSCCAKETPNHSSSLKRSASADNKYYSKQIKLKTVTTENDASEINDACEIVEQRKTSAMSDDIEKDDMLFGNGVVEQSLMWRIEDVRTEKDFPAVISSRTPAETYESYDNELYTTMSSQKLAETCEENDENSKMMVVGITCDQNSDVLHKDQSGEGQKKLRDKSVSNYVQKKEAREKRKLIPITNNKSSIGEEKNLNSDEEIKLRTIVKNKANGNDEKEMNSCEKKRKFNEERKSNVSEEKKLNSNEGEKLKIVEKYKLNGDDQRKMNSCEKQQRKTTKEKMSNIGEEKKFHFKEEETLAITEQKKSNVDEKKESDSSEEMKSKVAEQKTSTVNRIKISKDNEKIKNGEKLNGTIEPLTEVIDVEKLPDTFRKPSNCSDLTNFISKINFKCLPTRSSIRMTSDQRARIPALVTSLNSRPPSILPTSNQTRYPITSTPKTKPTANVSSSAHLPSVARCFNSHQLKPCLPLPSRPLNTSDVKKRLCAQGSTPVGTFRGSFARAAMAKRTMQTTEQKVVHNNNVITRTTTVVEESMMQVRSNNSCVPAGSNPGILVQNQRFSRVHRTEQIQKNSRQSFAKRFSTDEVITLD